MDALPRTAFLTSAPLQLSSAQEAALERVLAAELRPVPGFEALLKRVYLDLSNEDAALSGYVHFHQLSSYFALNQVSRTERTFTVHEHYSYR